MMPQASFLYAAAIQPERKQALRDVLLSMNRSPGIVDPHNPLIPFALLEVLHFARLLIVADLAASDRAVYGLPTSGLPDYLVLMGEIDGSRSAFEAQLLRRASAGLFRLFSHCIGCPAQEHFALWFSRLHVSAAAEYINWLGRTVGQVREEEALHQALESFLDEQRAALTAVPPRLTHQRLKEFVTSEQQRQRLTLTPSPPTPAGWRLRNLLHLVGVPVLLLLLSPLLLLVLPFFLIELRRREKTDPAIAPPVDPGHARELAAIENHDVTNQFSVFGSLKPGRFRRWSMQVFLFLTNYAARHVYHRGHLARVSTIHFARWIPFDDGQRMLFSSMYDGSLESYMDDFINKVGFGLNITFSGGIGYPRTRWLLLDGCRDEQVFKRVLRRHQLPTEVWYSAHPGLTAANKHRNGLIREGLMRTHITDAEARQWLQLL